MPLVEVARFDNSLDAGMARSHLAADGIESVLFDVGMSWLGGAIPVRLMTLDEDRDAAVGALQSAGLLK